MLEKKNISMQLSTTHHGKNDDIVNTHHRDDEHCTGLMLAASQGHSNLMRILLDNHASVNDLDKMKVLNLNTF